MMKNHKRQFKTTILAVIALVFGAFLYTSLVPLPAVAIDACTPDTWYRCPIKRKDLDALVSRWCAKAETLEGVDYKPVCRLKITAGSIYTSVTDLRRYNVKIPDYCNLGTQITDAQKLLIPDKCWAVISERSTWGKALANAAVDCPDGSEPSCEGDIIRSYLAGKGWAAAVPADKGTTNTKFDTGQKASDTKFMVRLVRYIRWFSSGIGILAVFGLVISGIQYTAAGDNPQAVAGAKKRIGNIVFGLFIYLFMFALLQWLIPGGLIGT